MESLISDHTNISYSGVNGLIFNCIGGALLLLFGLNFILSDCANFLGLVVINTLVTNTYVWNLVTSCFFETNIFKLAIDIGALWFASAQLTPSALTLEHFGLYFGFSVLSCTLSTSVCCFVYFATTGNQDIVLKSVYGFNGVLMALLMLIRQQKRNESVHNSFPIVTFHHLPVILLLIQIIFAFIGLKSMTTDLPFTVAAFFFSWSYLRFYYRYNEGEPLGDKTEEFSFVGMFPLVLHIILVPFTTAFYNIFALCGLFPVLELTEKKTFHHLRNVEAVNAADEIAPVLAKPDIVAERRRARALKLLDAKMAELSQEPEGWDENPSSGKDDIEAAVTRNAPELIKLKI